MPEPSIRRGSRDPLRRRHPAAGQAEARAKIKIKIKSEIRRMQTQPDARSGPTYGLALFKQLPSERTETRRSVQDVHMHGCKRACARSSLVRTPVFKLIRVLVRCGPRPCPGRVYCACTPTGTHTPTFIHSYVYTCIRTQARTHTQRTHDAWLLHECVRIHACTSACAHAKSDTRTRS